MKANALRFVVLFALLGVTFFGAVDQAGAVPPEPHPYCVNPESTVWETLMGFPIPPEWNAHEYNDWCAPGHGVATTPSAGKPASMKLFDGFVSVTVYGLPGADFKAFLYQHVPQPLVVPDGWYIYGYGADVFYDNGAVNPEGVICFGLPADVYGNFELGVFSFDGQNFSRMSSNACASFTGGGTFFLLMQTDTIRFFGPLDTIPT